MQYSDRRALSQLEINYIYWYTDSNNYRAPSVEFILQHMNLRRQVKEHKIAYNKFIEKENVHNYRDSGLYALGIGQTEPHCYICPHTIFPCNCKKCLKYLDKETEALFCTITKKHVYCSFVCDIFPKNE